MRPQRTLAAFVVVFVVAALAWAQPPAGAQKPAGQKPAAGQAKAGAGAAKALGTPADEAAIRALVEQYQQAFNAGDAGKAAGIFAENGVFVDAFGKAFEGRSEIEKQVAGGDTQGKPERLTLTVEAVRFIKPDVALMRGRSTTEGGTVPQGQGDGHWAAVSMKVAGQWKVVAAEAAVHPPMQGRGK